MPFVPLLYHPYATTLARWILAAVFLTSAMSKLPHQRHFIFVVLSYRVLPRRLAQVYASALPWLEAMAGLMLLLGVATALAAALSAVLLLSFTSAIVLNVVRGRTSMGCGCFGTGQQPKIGGKVLARNGALLLLAVQVMLFPRTYLALDGQLWTAGTGGPHANALTNLLVALLASAVLLLAVPLLKQATALRKSK